MGKFKKGVGVVALLGALYGAEVGLMPIIMPVQAQEKRSDSESELEKLAREWRMPLRDIRKIQRYMQRPVRETFTDANFNVTYLTSWEEYKKRIRYKQPSTETFKKSRPKYRQFLITYRNYINNSLVPDIQREVLQSNLLADKRKDVIFYIYSDDNKSNHTSPVRGLASVISKEETSKSKIVAVNIDGRKTVYNHQIELMGVSKAGCDFVPMIKFYSKNNRGKIVSKDTIRGGFDELSDWARYRDIYQRKRDSPLVSMKD